MIDSMDFGEVSNFTEINYTLPEEQFLSQSEYDRAKFFLGCPIWSNKELIKRIKSEADTGKSDLEIYSRSFQCIELNSCYYSTPSSTQIEKWKSQVSAEFLFFPKAPKTLTFEPREQVNSVALEAYLRSLSDFGQNLGDSFLQFSPYFSPSKKRALFHLLEELPSEFAFHIELRHRGWFEDPGQLQRLCEYLYKKNIGLVATDTPGRRDVLPMIFTNQSVFVRFKGNNFHDVDQNRLNNWVSIFTRTKRFRRVIFFHHHADEQYCIDSINFMAQKLEGLSKNLIPKIHIGQKSQLEFGV